MCNGANTFDTAALVFEVMLMFFFSSFAGVCVTEIIKSAHTFFGTINVLSLPFYSIFSCFFYYSFFYQMSAGNQSVFSCSTVQVSFGSITSLAMSCSDLQGPSLDGP